MADCPSGSASVDDRSYPLTKSKSRRAHARSTADEASMPRGSSLFVLKPGGFRGVPREPVAVLGTPSGLGGLALVRIRGRGWRQLRDQQHRARVPMKIGFA